MEAKNETNSINSWWLINYKEFFQGRIVCVEHENEVPYVTLHSALMNTFSDSNNAFIILDGFVMGLMKFLDSFYVFDSHARNCSGMPDPNGTAVIMKCSTINILFEYLCDLAFELNTNIFEVVPVEFTEEQKRHYQVLVPRPECSNIFKRKRSEISDNQKQKKILKTIQTQSRSKTRLDRAKSNKQNRIIEESESERRARLNRRNAIDRQKRLNETEDERQTRLNKRNAFDKQKRLNETDSERQARLNKRKSFYKKKI